MNRTSRTSKSGLSGLSRETSFATSTMVCKTASNVTVSPQSPGTVLEAPPCPTERKPSPDSSGQAAALGVCPRGGYLSVPKAQQGGEDRTDGSRLSSLEAPTTHPTPSSRPSQLLVSSLLFARAGQSQQVGLSAQGSRPYRRALPTQTALDPGSATCCPGWGVGRVEGQGMDRRGS